MVGIVAAIGLDDDTFVAGDIRLVAENVEFGPDAISGSGGSVGVFIENNDPIRHTLAIEALNIEIELPANTARRLEINAPAGTHDFTCTVSGHEKMTGTLTLGGLLQTSGRPYRRFFARS